MPIALQCNLDISWAADTLIHLGLWAARVEPNRIDVVYPFLCIDRHGSTEFWFSSSGPDDITRRSIGRAFWMRLLNAGDYLTDFEATVVDADTGERCHYSCRESRLSYRTEHG